MRQLQALGCDKVFSGQVSSVADRGRLTAALEYVREGDTHAGAAAGGIAAAKAAGRHKGWAPSARAKAAEIHRLAAEGVGKAEITRRLGVGERSVYRMLAGRG